MCSPSPPLLALQTRIIFAQARSLGKVLDRPGCTMASEPGGVVELSDLLQYRLDRCTHADP